MYHKQCCNRPCIVYRWCFVLRDCMYLWTAGVHNYNHFMTILTHSSNKIEGVQKCLVSGKTKITSQINPLSLCACMSECVRMHACMSERMRVHACMNVRICGAHTHNLQVHRHPKYIHSCMHACTHTHVSI